ncbi:hypothetical protein FQN49_008714, partial [Arthroderma sp. PD_2]
MPRKPSPTLEEIAFKSDSNDGDYDDKEPRPSKRPTRSSNKPKKRTSKKRKRDFDDDLDDDSESSEEEEDGLSQVSEESENPNVERTARGSVKRQAASKTLNYIEPESSSEEDNIKEEQDVQDEVEPPKKEKRQKLIVKLSVLPQATTTSNRATRSRARSTSIQQQDVVNTRHATRRSARITHDDREDIIALSGSGRHVETIRQGTRSPDPIAPPPPRPENQLSQVEEEEEAEGNESKILRDEDEDYAHVEHVGASQVEIMESDPQGGFEDDAPAVAASDNIQPPPEEVTDAREPDVEMGEDGFIPESQHDHVEQEEDDDEEEDEDEGPVSRMRTRRSRVEDEEEPAAEQAQAEKEGSQPTRRSSRRTAGKRSRRPGDDGSDFEPNEESHEEEELSDSAPSQASPQKDDGSGNEPRSRLRKRQRYSHSRGESEAREIAEELAELRTTRSRRKKSDIVYEDKPRRTRKSVDYRLIRPELVLPLEESEVEPAGSPSRRGGRGGGSTWQRTLFSTYGPFGGAGPLPLLG